MELWREYEENMNQSSVWWHTLYGRQNLTSQAENGPLLDEIGQTRPGAVPAVSWWQVGQEVLGMSEWPEGQRVDPHSMVHLGDFDYKDRDDGNFLGEGFSNAHSAAHEQYEGGNEDKYRVTIQVDSNLPLTSKQKLHFSKWDSYKN